MSSSQAVSVSTRPSHSVFRSFSSLSKQNLETAPSEIVEDITLIRIINKAKFPVFLGYSASKNKNFAMKLFNIEENEPNICFQNELRFANLNHLNVINLISADCETPFSYGGQDQMVSCILMEYAPYGDLSNFIHKLGAGFTEKIARTYFRQLIDGLEYLHNNDICHFDLKLPNLLIGDDYQLKIADFDLSHIRGDSYIMTNGSRYYRAPELKNRRSGVGQAADIYSAGIILFMLKCGGKLPHTEEQFCLGFDLEGLLNKDSKEFFKAHEVIQDKDSSFFDKKFRELFVAMTKEDPSERITIKDIKKSKWYKESVYSPKDLKKKIQKILVN